MLWRLYRFLMASKLGFGHISLRWRCLKMLLEVDNESEEVQEAMAMATQSQTTESTTSKSRILHRSIHFLIEKMKIFSDEA